MTDEWRVIPDFDQYEMNKETKDVRRIDSEYILKRHKGISYNLVDSETKVRERNIEKLYLVVFERCKMEHFTECKWQEHPKYKGYFLSDTGLLWSTRANSMLVGSLLNGYMNVMLTYEGRRVHAQMHQMVLEAFIGPPPTPAHTPNHKNRNTVDNNLINLEWASKSEQILHMYETGGEGPLKKPVLQFDQKMNLVESFDCMTAARNKFGYAVVTINKYLKSGKPCKNGFIWKCKNDETVEPYENLPDEVWKELVVPGKDGITHQVLNHFVSNMGRFRNGDFIRDVHFRKTGYAVIGLTGVGLKCKSYSVHRLIAFNFIPNPDNLPEVDHVDGNNENNRADNLQWIDRATHNKKTSGKPVLQCDLEGNVIKRWDTVQDVCRKLGYDGRHLYNVCNGYKKSGHGFLWKYVEE